MRYALEILLFNLNVDGLMSHFFKGLTLNTAVFLFFFDFLVAFVKKPCRFSFAQTVSFRDN